MSDGEKEEEQETGTEIERVFQYHKIIFIENNPMFPCWYSHTNTPTAVRPLTESLDKGDKSFFVLNWQVERAGLGASVCKEATALKERG